MQVDFDLAKEIKAHADIVDVISHYLSSVQKKGRRYVAMCPFHDDHDPSLQIDKEKQIFRCFVCDSGGDVFSFVQKHENCTFIEAMRKVAEIVGFDDPRLHQRTYVKKVDENLVPIYDCLTEIQKFYAYAMTTDEGKVARDYLDNRHLSIEQREKFGLGYSFKDGKTIIQFLQKKGFSLKNIENTGIGLVQTTGMNDSNSGRLIFPIHNADGQVVGFSARRLIDDDSPKYVNSPETKVFTKSSILYNLHNAIKTARHDGYIYVVEGFMDVFALDSIGITSCVALMSTKLTNNHIDMLRKLNVEIRLCLDGDKPGQEAMMRIMSQLDEHKLKYRLVSIPGEVRDPDEILKQDGDEKLKVFVNSLVDPFNFALNYYKNISPLGSVDDRKKVINHFIPTIVSLSNELEKDDYIYKLADATGFSANAIKNSVKSYSNKKVRQEPNYNVNNVKTSSFDSNDFPKEYKRLYKAENLILTQMLYHKEAIEFYEKNIKYFNNSDYRYIANVIIEEKDKGNEVDVNSVISSIQSSDIENANNLIKILTDIGFAKPEPYSDKLLFDCMNAIVYERDKLHDKTSVLKALEGKTPQEQARIVEDYFSRQRNKGH